MLRKTLAFLILLIYAVPASWSDAATAPAIYYTYKSSSTSDYIPEYDITLESDTYNLMQDFPAANMLNQIDWTSSQSFAQSYIVAKTSGNRLFRLRGSGTGALEVQEYNPSTLQPATAYAYIGTADLFNYTSVINVEISGDNVYWFNNGNGREFYNLTTGDRDFLSVSCRQIAGSATHVFCMEITDESGAISSGGDYIEFLQIDRATGDVQYNHGRWYFSSNNSTTQSWQFAADGAVVYAARPNGNNTELWGFDTAAFVQSGTESPTLQFSEDLGGHPSKLDAHDGYVMLASIGNSIIIYDTSTETSETITTTLNGPSYPEFIIQEVTEPSAPNPDPTPGTGDNLGVSTGSDGGGGGGCFIATAAYGSLMEPHVKILRYFRDRILLNNSLGKGFVQAYYRYSPPIADYISKHDNLRAVVRLSLLPLVGISWVALKIGPTSTAALVLIFMSCFVGFVWHRRGYRE